MATQTTNYQMTKPDYTDTADIEVLNDNFDVIDSELFNRKTKQSAVADPSASGTSVTFIKSITQNTNGVISPAKATVSTMGGATASAAGSAGLVPQPTAGKQGQYLRGDGTWNTPTNTTYSEANASTYGLVKTGFSTSGQNYAVQLSGGKMYVNVPWTNTTYSEANASTYGLVKTGYTTNGKNYAVQLSSGQMFVNVPWADTNNWRPVALNGSVKLSTDGGTTLDLVPGSNISITHSNGGKFTFAADLSSCVKTSGNQSLSGVVSFTNTTAASSTSSGAVKIAGGLGVAKNIYGNKVYNAVWNDYAEFRKGCTEKGGYCVVECPDGVMRKSHKRLQPGARLTSDTYGSCMGYTSEARTPVAVAGRVLAYPCGDRGKFSLGAAVCSGPDGTVSVMSRREIRKYPERIVGTVSEIPDYEEWNAGTEENPETVKVDGRIWIYVR